MDRDKCLREENQKSTVTSNRPSSPAPPPCQAWRHSGPVHGCPCPVTGLCPLTSVTSRSWRSWGVCSSQLSKCPIPHISTSCPRPACRTCPHAGTNFERPSRPMQGQEGRCGDPSSTWWAAGSLRKPKGSFSSDAAPAPTAHWCAAGSGPSAPPLSPAAL